MSRAALILMLATQAAVLGAFAWCLWRLLTSRDGDA